MFVQHRKDFSKCLEILKNPFSLKEMDQKKLSWKDFTPVATYDSYNSFYFFLYPADKGPAFSVMGDFIFNGYLQAQHWGINVIQGEAVNNVKIHTDQSVIFDLDYPRPLPSAWDYASDDETEDILLWVSRHKKREQFASCWTVPYDDSCLSFFDQVKK